MTKFRVGDQRAVGGYQQAKIIMTVVLLLAGGSVRALDGWMSSWGGAKDVARQSNKPLLVMFVAEGCHSCAEMESHLANSRARAALRNAVKTRLEWSEYRHLGEGFGVDGTPTIFLFSPDVGFDSFVYKDDGVMSLKSIIALGRQIDRLAGVSEIESSSSNKGDEHALTTDENAAEPAKTIAGITELPASAKVPGSPGRRIARRQEVRMPGWYVPPEDALRGGPSW